MNPMTSPGRIGQLQDTHQRELQDVFTERDRQLFKFGPQNRTPQQWFLILSEEVGEVAKECVEIEFDDARHPYADPERYYKELTEVAAVALAAMQNFNQRRQKLATAAAVAFSTTKETLAAAFSARFGFSITPGDIRDIMPIGVTPGGLDAQVTVNGFTNWYGVKPNAGGTPDPNSIEQYPF